MADTHPPDAATAADPTAADPAEATTLPPLTDARAKAIAQELGSALGERQTVLIARVVKALGEVRVRALLAQALEIEAAGGMMVADGSRRRTSGGVFFQLVRQHLPPQERYRLFATPSGTRKKGGGTGAGEPSAATREMERLARAAWAQRAHLVETLVASKDIGAIINMKVTLIGRPGQVQRPGPFVLTTMRAPQKAPTLPKGLPPMPQSNLVYLVYIAERQWKKVEVALQNPEDVLIVEGHLTYDAELKKMCVFAQSVTTKLLQQATREAQKRAAEGGAGKAAE